MFDLYSTRSGFPDDDDVIERFGGVDVVIRKPLGRVGLLSVWTPESRGRVVVFPGRHSTPLHGPKLLASVLAKLDAQDGPPKITGWHTGHFVAPPIEDHRRAATMRAERAGGFTKIAVTSAAEAIRRRTGSLPPGWVVCQDVIAPPECDVCTLDARLSGRPGDPCWDEDCHGRLQPRKRSTERAEHTFCVRCGGRGIFYAGRVTAWDLALLADLVEDSTAEHAAERNRIADETAGREPTGRRRRGPRNFRAGPSPEEYVKLPRDPHTHIVLARPGDHSKGTRVLDRGDTTFAGYGGSLLLAESGLSRFSAVVGYFHGSGGDTGGACGFPGWLLEGVDAFERGVARRDEAAEAAQAVAAGRFQDADLRAAQRLVTFVEAARIRNT